MTDGPNGPVIDNLADIRLELMQLNLYIRDLLTVSSRELPAPVVNVAPTPVIVESAPASPAQPVNLDGLYDRLAALRGDPAGSLEQLLELNKQIKDLSVGMRAIAGSSVSSGGVGGGTVRPAEPFPVKNDPASPFSTSVSNPDFPLPSSQVTDLKTVKLDTAVEHFTSPGLAQKVLAGKARIAGAKQNMLVGQNSSLHIANPAGSGVNLLVTSLIVQTDTSAEVIYFKDATSSGAVVTPANPHFPSTALAKAEVRSGVNALSGGTQLTPFQRVTTNSPIEFDGLVVVGPGQSVAVRYLNPGASAAAYFNIRWFEEPF